MYPTEVDTTPLTLQKAAFTPQKHLAPKMAIFFVLMILVGLFGCPIGCDRIALRRGAQRQVDRSALPPQVGRLWHCRKAGRPLLDQSLEEIAMALVLPQWQHGVQPNNSQNKNSYAIHAAGREWTIRYRASLQVPCQRQSSVAGIGLTGS